MRSITHLHRSGALRRRRAAALVVAMVVLLVLTLLGAELVRTLMLAHQRSRAADRETQALWLAESGLERALAQLQADPQYAGETWQPTIGERDSDEADGVPSKVVITIEETGSSRQLRAQAYYPDHPTDRVLVERVHPLPTTAEANP
jgi:type II secretory pathway pseudopilin PulG